jgi:hypothetical protein
MAHPDRESERPFYYAFYAAAPSPAVWGGGVRWWKECRMTEQNPTGILEPQHVGMIEFRLSGYPAIP